MAEEVGRKTIMTEIVVKKLEEAFTMGCSDVEACLYAGISKQTLYNYQKKVPEFVDRKMELKNNPLLKARRTIYEGLDKVETAKWYAERKAKKEFSIKQELDVTSQGEKIVAFNYTVPNEQ
jgi:hypothetical protein